MNSLALKAAFLVYFLYSMRTVIRTESSVLICLLFSVLGRFSVCFNINMILQVLVDF